ncbi:hypothetical protein RSOL_316240, partial [Rhizoctonia solani AG-3 Rhs1AP]
MPANKGAISNNLRECDPRCQRHTNAQVNPRVHKDCKRRLDLEEKEASIVAPSAGSKKSILPLDPLDTARSPTLTDSTIVPVGATNGELVDSGPVMDNPRDDATLPVLGTPAELEVMDEATDYWADADDNGDLDRYTKPNIS